MTQTLNEDDCSIEDHDPPSRHTNRQGGAGRQRAHLQQDRHRRSRADWRIDCAGGAAALAVRARDRRRQQGRARDGDASARDRRGSRRPDRPCRVPTSSFSPPRCDRTSRCSTSSMQTCGQPAVVTDTGSTKRDIVDAGAPAAAAIYVRRRTSARRRGPGRPRARATRPVQGTAVAVHAGRRWRGRIARKAPRVRLRPGRGASGRRRVGPRPHRWRFSAICRSSPPAH